MNPVLAGKLRSMARIVAFSCFAGVVYQLVAEDLVDERSILIGLPLGFVFGILELFPVTAFQRRLSRLPFSWLIVVKTLTYTLAVYLVIAFVTLAGGYMEGRSLREFTQVMASRSQAVLILYTLLVYLLIVLFFQIDRLLGRGVLFKFVRGKYHKPTVEQRIFMFLDIRSSTRVAERLGDRMYYAWLNEFFHEITEPVLEMKAEVYDYVGDEVILTWRVEYGLEDGRCLEVFFRIQQRIREKREWYTRKYGEAPEFKAAVHLGEVISAQIGDIKREIVYNGDVLNTTARMRDLCNELGRDLLVSGALLSRLGPDRRFEVERMDTGHLRGKKTDVEIYAVRESPDKKRVSPVREGAP